MVLYWVTPHPKDGGPHRCTNRRRGRDDARGEDLVSARTWCELSQENVGQREGCHRDRHPRQSTAHVWLFKYVEMHVLPGLLSKAMGGNQCSDDFAPT